MLLIDLTFDQVRNQGAKTPLENFSPPLENVLDIVWNYWT